MDAFDLLKNALKNFRIKATVVQTIVIIEEPDDQKRDRIEKRLELLGYEIEHVSCNAIHVRLKKVKVINFR